MGKGALPEFSKGDQDGRGHGRLSVAGSMKVLIACEESQAVTVEFRKLGHEAYSCDIEPCSGGHPEWHIQGDALEVMNGEWDFIFAFPPCTHYSCSGARWFPEKRRDGRQQGAIEFTRKIWIRIKQVKFGGFEAPVSILPKHIGTYTQIVHPWQFGHPEQKTTCLWLHNLPRLIATQDVKAEMMSMTKKERSRIHYLPPSKDRAKIRSKTFPGIAQAMAAQWGKL